MHATISPKQLADLRQSGQTVDLIDVRTPAEYGESHAQFARNIPLDRLAPGSLAAGRSDSDGGPLYVICRSGKLGGQACDRLAAAGLNAVNVEGGMLAWDAAGLPAVRGRKAVSLERQVRIAAGLLVLSGSVLGYFVHPFWIGLAAIVGAGLTLAGITDTCGMARVLARMPWNQAPANGVAATSAPACPVPNPTGSCSIPGPGRSCRIDPRAN